MSFPKPLLQQEGYKIRKCVELAIEADIPTIELYSVFYIGILCAFDKLVK